jgi:hypothetical protein
MVLENYRSLIGQIRHDRAARPGSGRAAPAPAEPAVAPRIRVRPPTGCAAASLPIPPAVREECRQARRQSQSRQDFLIEQAFERLDRHEIKGWRADRKRAVRLAGPRDRNMAHAMTHDGAHEPASGAGAGRRPGSGRAKS